MTRRSDAELVEAFRYELESLCKRYDLSLYHQDYHGCAYLVRGEPPRCDIYIQDEIAEAEPPRIPPSPSEKNTIDRSPSLPADPRVRHAMAAARSMSHEPIVGYVDRLGQLGQLRLCCVECFRPGGPANAVYINSYPHAFKACDSCGVILNYRFVPPDQCTRIRRAE